MNRPTRKRIKRVKDPDRRKAGNRFYFIDSKGNQVFGRTRGTTELAMLQDDRMARMEGDIGDFEYDRKRADEAITFAEDVENREATDLREARFGGEI